MTDTYRAYWGNRDIWWTPYAMRLQIKETKDNFELYIGDLPLQKHLSEGTLFSVDKQGKQYHVAPKDITVRLNNWEKIRASLLSHTTLTGFAFGVALTLLVTGLIQFFQQRKSSR